MRKKFVTKESLITDGSLVWLAFNSFSFPEHYFWKTEKRTLHGCGIIEKALIKEFTPTYTDSQGRRWKVMNERIEEFVHPGRRLRIYYHHRHFDLTITSVFLGGNCKDSRAVLSPEKGSETVDLKYLPNQVSAFVMFPEAHELPMLRID